MSSLSSYPTVSIVTPSFNHAQFIGETICSVLSQKGDFFIDYIIMDGGSTDETLSILESYSNALKEGNLSFSCKGGNLRYISQKDKGQADAINKGFALAEGDVLCWLNSDDIYYDPSSISKIVNRFLTDPGVFFLYAKGYRINEQGKICGEEKYTEKYSGNDLLEVDFILQPSSFWRREVLNTIGELNTSYHFAFDWEYWLRVAEKFELYFLDEFISCNRIHRNTKTNIGGLPRAREIFNLLKKKGRLSNRSLCVFHLLDFKKLENDVKAEITRLDFKRKWLYRRLPAFIPGKVRRLIQRLLWMHRIIMLNNV